ncbi:hypothetical protein PG994_008703 [Apiospora phragmitis]|uniref:Uncharacterized protein n=1 Tax=Apiospora phragmitis TaxID=2905665 RepID=A0ABR1UH75_9PEZI
MPACANPHEFLTQCQECKENLGASSSSSIGGKAGPARPVPAMRPSRIGDQPKKRKGAALLKPLLSGHVRRKLTEIESSKDQKRTQAEAAATALLKQQQPQPQQPQTPPSLEKSTFDLQDIDTAVLRQYFRDDLEELARYHEIIRQDDPKYLQQLLDVLEPKPKKQKQKQPAQGTTSGEVDISSLFDNMALDVADDDRDQPRGPFSDDMTPGTDLTLAQIIELLPDQEPNASRTTKFDYSQPAPAPDTSGLIDLGDSDDEDLQRFIGIGDDDDDDDAYHSPFEPI